ncbi:FAD binding domain-containing protein [Shimia sp.]|uniref:FAD binding domain-containing protein n=1 Tax=Shimia sp. TaxID=1954381 RepID=UPI003B8AE57C
MGIYHRPDKLKDALRILAQQEVTVAAGCTDLFAATQAQVLSGAVLDVTNVKDLKGITETAGAWRIGAAVSWSDLLAQALPSGFDMLKQAARQVGGVQVQNAGTVVGNICNASPAADGMPPLLALDAQVELVREGGTRVLTLADFVTGPRQIARQHDEIVSAVLIPTGSAVGGSAFHKLGARKHLVISIAMVAVRVVVAGGLVTEVAIAVGACGPVATRLPEIEAALLGVACSDIEAVLDEESMAASLQPISDIRGHANYRLDVVPEMVRRALTEAVTSTGALL